MERAGQAVKHAPQPVRQEIYWLLLAAILLVLLFVVRMVPKDDWSQFKPDLLASLIAVAVGIPLGLMLNRLAEDWRRKLDLAEQDRRRRVVLEGLLAEMDQHATSYAKIVTHDAPDEALIPLADCRDHFWRALAASGGLNLIDDASLLNKLSISYYLAEMFNGWARAMREVYMLNTPLPYRSELIARAWPHLVEAARKASGSRGETLQAIRRHLPQ